MHLPRADPKRAPRPQRATGEQRRGVVGLQPVQRPSQTIVVEVLGRDPRSQQPLDRLVGEELRHQVQPAIAETEPVQDHGHCRRADPDPFMALVVLRVQPLGETDLPTDAGHDPQVIQPLGHIGV